MCMKSKLSNFLSLYLLVSLVVILGMQKGLAYPTGAPAGYTGSPFDNKNCTNCHGGSASTVTGWITSNIPAQGYTAGQSYTITLTSTGSGNKGFEISPMTSAGAVLGTMTPGTGSKLVGGVVYLTHSSAKTSNPATWTFTWVAPAAGTGSVTFYCAFVVTKPVTKLCTMTVNESLPLGVTVTANPNTITSGQSSQLNAAAVGGSGTYTYTWTSNPPGFTSAIQNPVVTPTATTIYTCSVGDGSGTASGNATVTVNIPAPLAVVASASPSSITSGQSSQLNAAVSGGSGTYTYSWSSVPAGFSSNSQNPVVWPTATTKYIITVNDGSQTKKDSTTVAVSLASLFATASATPSTICLGQSSQLNVAATGGTGSYIYTWSSVPAGFTSTAANPQVSPLVTTKYLVHTVSGTMSRNDSTVVTVNQPATAVAGGDSTYFTGVTQVPVHGTATSYSSVLWTTSGTGTFSAANSLIGFYNPSTADKTSGSVILTLTASPLSPCSVPAVSTRHIYFSTVGINPAGNQPAFQVSPNPCNGIFRLRLKGDFSNDLSVVITDIRGTELLKQSIQAISGSMSQFDISNFPKGIYFVKIQSGNIAETQKLIVN